MKIIIADVIDVPYAILRKHGSMLFDVLDRAIAKNEKIEISFKGLASLNSAFVNASLGKLYSKYGDKLEDVLLFSDIKKEEWKNIIKASIFLSLNPKEAQKLDRIISELFG